MIMTSVIIYVSSSYDIGASYLQQRLTVSVLSSNSDIISQQTVNVTVNCNCDPIEINLNFSSLTSSQGDFDPFYHVL